MLNRVELIGRLTEEPRCGGSPPQSYGFITLAVNTQYTDKNGEKQQKSEFIPIAFFRGAAELVQRFCHKGTLLHVEGSVSIRKKVNNDGSYLEKVEIHGQKIIFLDKIKPAPRHDDDYPG